MDDGASDATSVTSAVNDQLKSLDDKVNLLKYRHEKETQQNDETIEKNKGHKVCFGDQIQLVHMDSQMHLCV